MLAVTLARSKVLARGRLKYRSGRIVDLSFSADGETMGSGFPKEWRDALVEAKPEKFSLPDESDLRFHRAHVRLAAIDVDEMRDLVERAWAMVVPRRVVRSMPGPAVTLDRAGADELSLVCESSTAKRIRTRSDGSRLQ